ncbi:RNA polymerase sigma factor [Aliiroseovarius sp. YM-037]|uniref:RNA polymerase sigma factor n=1 Tax=Aliiroseovarius sp. YM-037 TaxID=3341728 RepID=UPI003A813A53
MPRTSDDRSKALTELMPDLARAARRLTRDRSTAEDLMQETLLRVWARMDTGTEIEDLRPYLMTTVRNLSRRPPRVFDELEEKDTPATPAGGDRRLITQDVVRAIEMLPPAHARLLTLAARDQAQYADMAREIGVPVGTVMSRLARARHGLRKSLDLPESDAVAELLANAD